jgi:hypothetical protein
MRRRELRLRIIRAVLGPPRAVWAFLVGIGTGVRDTCISLWGGVRSVLESLGLVEKQRPDEDRDRHENEWFGPRGGHP